MSFRTRLILLIVAILVLLLAPYFLWHEPLDTYFASDEYQQWLGSAKSYGWAVGLGLLAADAFLPIPSAPVMTTMGALYGTWLGGLVSAIGSIMAGFVGLGIGRLAGPRALRRFASEAELAALGRFFDSWGAAGIVASRALPVAPEVLTVLAGIARMRLVRFLLALVLGALPVGLMLAWCGNQTGPSSGLLLVMTLVPASLWVVYLLLMHRATAKKFQ
jgi:uncharacterized membrane protein YdjX (TVP38/TMEM64 family)